MLGFLSFEKNGGIPAILYILTKVGDTVSYV